MIARFWLPERIACGRAFAIVSVGKLSARRARRAEQAGMGKNRQTFVERNKEMDWENPVFKSIVHICQIVGACAHGDVVQTGGGKEKARAAGPAKYFASA